MRRGRHAPVREEGQGLTAWIVAAMCLAALGYLAYFVWSGWGIW